MRGKSGKKRGEAESAVQEDAERGRPEMQRIKRGMGECVSEHADLHRREMGLSLMAGPKRRGARRFGPAAAERCRRDAHFSADRVHHARPMKRAVDPAWSDLPIGDLASGKRRQQEHTRTRVHDTWMDLKTALAGIAAIELGPRRASQRERRSSGGEHRPVLGWFGSLLCRREGKKKKEEKERECTRVSGGHSRGRRRGAKRRREEGEAATRIDRVRRAWRENGGKRFVG